MSKFICMIHVGAGYHNIDNENEYKYIMMQCLNKIKFIYMKYSNTMDNIDNINELKLKFISTFGIKDINNYNISNRLMISLLAISEGLILLENNELTNAGYGSSLTYSGIIESDSSFSLSNINKNKFTAVGAVPYLINPSICVIRMMIERNNNIFIKPINTPVMLVGSGATNWFENLGIKVNKQLDSNVTTNNYEKWKSYKEKLDKLEISDIDNHGTIGIIFYDGENAYSITISGGSWMKQSGRVGHSAILGAASSTKYEKFPIACSTTGDGEQIIEFMLSDKIVSACEIELSLEEYDPEDCIRNVYSQFLECNINKRAGSISFQVLDENECFMNIAHTTKSIGYGYYSSSMNEPIAKFSRLFDEDKMDGRVVQTSSWVINY